MGAVPTLPLCICTGVAFVSYPCLKDREVGQLFLHLSPIVSFLRWFSSPRLSEEVDMRGLTCPCLLFGFSLQLSFAPFSFELQTFRSVSGNSIYVKKHAFILVFGRRLSTAALSLFPYLFRCLRLFIIFEFYVIGS